MAEPGNVGLGEQRFNAVTAIYKSTHNSYTHDESLARQIDDYNVWQLELDIWDFAGDLKVYHGCSPLLFQAPTLQTFLNKMITESKTYSYKFTIIYLDMKGNDGCFMGGGWGADLNERIKIAFIESLGIGHIYPSHEFITGDENKWPSFQELVRRGYYWGIVIDWHDKTPENAEDDPLMFQAISKNPLEATSVYANSVLVCIEGGCDSKLTNDAPEDPRGDRWLYRTYPGEDCASHCEQHIGDYWDGAIDKGYNFIATNCVNRAATFVSSTHSPSPLFVDQSAIIACPLDNETCEWGTLAFPYHNLADAINRASPMVTLLIKEGIYVLRDAAGKFRINRPLRLKAVGGIVRIR